MVDYLFSRFHVWTNHGVAGYATRPCRRALHRHRPAAASGTLFSVGREAPDRLLPHERMLYDHVVRLAGNGSVPAQALTLGSAGQSASWLKRFDGLVTQNSRSNGLYRVVGLGFGDLGRHQAWQAWSLRALVIATRGTGKRDRGRASSPAAWRWCFRTQRLRRSSARRSSRRGGKRDRPWRTGWA